MGRIQAMSVLLWLLECNFGFDIRGEIAKVGKSCLVIALTFICSRSECTLIVDSDSRLADWSGLACGESSLQHR